MSEYLDIRLAVEQGRLREALESLQGLAAKRGDYASIDMLRGLEQAYRFMLKYMVEGVPDLSRDHQLAQLRQDLLRQVDRIERETQVKDSPAPYYEAVRMERLSPVSLQARLADFSASDAKLQLALSSGMDDPATRQEWDKALQELFKRIWIAFPMTNVEADQLEEALLSEESPLALKAHIISALLLADLQFHDPQRLRLLLKAYDGTGDNEPEVQARLLVSIILMLALANSVHELDDDLVGRLSMLNDSLVSFHRIRVVLINLIRAFDTDRINKKMQDEVLPEFMRLRPEIMKRMGDWKRQMEKGEMDVNPEWEELLSKSGIADKMREFQDMQTEGSDVMMMAFSNLKQYPFFSQIPNWFLPFDASHSSLSQLAGKTFPGMDLLFDDKQPMGMCNSDKYSFALSLIQLPESQRSALQSQMGSQLGDMREQLQEELKSQGLSAFDSAVIRYVRDLYRFFRLYPKRKHFHDPFSAPLDFCNLQVIGPELADDENLLAIGEFFFARGYWGRALPLFQTLERRKLESGEGLNEGHLLEKIGYCLQKDGNSAGALEYYHRAYDISPKGKWLLRRLASLERNAGNFEAAATYYSRLTELDPDNMGLTLNLGKCLTAAGKATEALKCFQKANYMDADNMEAIRGMAWCELLLRHYDKSRENYERIILLEPTASDYLNAGHQALLACDTQRAQFLYLQSARANEQGLEGFRKDFEEDWEMLEGMGTDSVMLPLLYDSVAYNFKP